MKRVIAIAKKNKDVLKISDPNDFLFHSDYNTFKIIKTAEATITVGAGVTNQDYNIAHGLPFIPFVTAFAKESTVSQVIAPNAENITGVFGTGMGYFTTNLFFNSISSDATSVIVNFSNTSGSDKTVKVRYYCLEGLGNEVVDYPSLGRRSKIVVAKENVDAFSETDPRKFKFHSDYGTLKYFTKLSASVLLGSGKFAAAGSVTHDLGYYPYVEVYVKNPVGEYEYCPSNNGGATVNYGTVFAITTTQIKLYTTSTGFMSDQTFDFLIFVFKNNLLFS